MNGLMFLAFVIGAVGWICLSVKVGFIVGQWAKDTGFDAGFYMMALCGMLALPLAVVLEVFN